MTVVVFGSYDAKRHPRVRVLIEGLRQSGAQVLECNEPLGLSTAERVGIVRQPWKLPVFLLHLGRAWLRLWRRGRHVPPPDAVVVGYMGHFDVHLARRIWPAVPIVLDYLISAADTARDRRLDQGNMLRILGLLDRRALQQAEVIAVDTEEHLAMLPDAARARGCVVPVGAPAEWFRQPKDANAKHLRVIFFGLYTPLQGTQVVGEAIAILAEEPIQFLMIGHGQDYDESRNLARSNPNATWIDWVDSTELVEQVAGHDVCLGIFGTGAKAKRVVPNKVYQGAAAGCVIVTSDTAPQRRALGEVGVYVPSGDGSALAAALRGLERNRADLWARRQASFRLAQESFVPRAVVRPLTTRLAELCS